MRYSPGYFHIILFTLTVAFTACQTSQNQVAAIQETATCTKNPKHTYEVFVPQHGNSKQGLPLIVAIDPHGKGKNALTHLTSSVKVHASVLVASNLIKNGDRNYVQELNELIADVREKHPVNDKIHLIGFSGGARMALGYSTNHKITGVLASGAFASNDQLASISCPVYALLGLNDFNFIETAQFLFNPASLPPNVHIELTNASHEWPDEHTLMHAMSWFFIDNSTEKTALAKDYIEARKNQIDSLIQHDEPVKAYCISKTMASKKVFDLAGDFTQQAAELSNSKEYKNQLVTLSGILQEELNTKKVYLNALIDRDTIWWHNEIEALNTRIVSSTDSMHKSLHQRLKGFLGIVCYSYSQQFAAQNEMNKLEQVVNIYQLIEPDNPDMLHFKKVLNELKSRE